jgi:hypothetical protein
MLTVECSFLMPLGEDVHDWADDFASRCYEDEEKEASVYLNTLAVYALSQYLKLRNIESSLEDSNSWDPVQQYLTNIADLAIPGVGYLECCPFMAGENSFTVDEENLADRIGYVAIQFEEDLASADILGFIPAVDNPEKHSGEFEIDELQPLEHLIKSLTSKKQSVVNFSLTTKEIPVVSQIIQLRQNYLNIKHFEKTLKGFLNIFDEFLFPPDIRLALKACRKESQNWKFTINELPDFNILLVIWINPEEQYFKLLVQLFSLETQKSFPKGLVVRLYANAECIQEIHTKENDVLIQADIWKFNRQEYASIHIYNEKCTFVQGINTLDF